MSALFGKCSALSGQNPPFVLQQPSLAIETSCVAGERAVAADDAVTGNDYGNGVVTCGTTHRA